MAAGAQCVRLCLRRCGQSSTLQLPIRRHLATSPAVRRRLWDAPKRLDRIWRNTKQSEEEDGEDFEEVEGIEDDDFDPAELSELFREGRREPTQAELETLAEEATRELSDNADLVPSRSSDERLERQLVELEKEMASFSRVPKIKREDFWAEDEDDPDMIVAEDDDDEFQEDDILGMAHGKLEELREQRQYARVAMWEMPLLSKLAKPFERPGPDDVLRFRYTYYMGEFHPAEKKVVVEFCTKDLPITKEQALKLAKLAGPRYNPETQVVRMSSEMFEHQAQNKRYLGDLVDKLIAEAKDPTDMFEDIPLDTRHHTFKKKQLKFPNEWRMTAGRQAQLQALRQESLLLDEGKKTAGRLIDGAQLVQQSLPGMVDPDTPSMLAKLVTVATPQNIRKGSRNAGMQFRA